jgi:3'(2'), 5'-bisphosphate nucleotidase
MVSREIGHRQLILKHERLKGMFGRELRMASGPELSGRNAAAWRMMLAAACGARAIRRISALNTTAKADGSPVTAADLASDRAIRRLLAQDFKDSAIVSEESPGAPRSDHYLLVDPLDGTREFIAGTGEFAICIAEIDQERPVAGVILAPEQRIAWMAGETATRVELDGALKPRISTFRQLVPARAPERSYVTSRFHLDEAVRNFGRCHPDWHAVTIGAALKFAAVAEGRARLYPRGPGPQTWDVAAGEALLIACGGLVLGTDGNPIRYVSGPGTHSVGGFIAGIDPAEVRNALARWQNMP